MPTFPPIRSLSPLVLLSCCWLAVVLLVNPIGNFPLNDDWSFGQSVFNLVKEGQLVLEDWQDMTLLVQLFWGGFFCKLFGCSFTVLRLANLLLGLIGVWGTYRLFDDWSKDQHWAMILTLCLTFNPWYCSLSFGFMTDVPFYVCMIWSYRFYLKALKNSALSSILWGTFFAVLAIGIRQFGILAPLSFALAFVALHRNGRAVGMALLVLLIGFASLQGYIYWLESLKPLSSSFGNFEQLLQQLKRGLNGQEIGVRIGQMLFYSGLWLLPALLLNASFVQSGLRYWRSGLGACLLSLFLAYIAWDRLPTGNILNQLSIGPPTLKNGVWGQHGFWQLPMAAWAFVKGLGFFGGFLLLWQLFKNATASKLADWQKETLAIRLMSMIALVLYCGYLSISFLLWDRYFMLLLPLVVLLVFPKYRRASAGFRTLGWGLLLLIALFSALATHDYLAWNRARWEALDLLEEQGVAAAEIDGGFEYNAWRKTNNGKRNAINQYGKSWWFVEEDQSIISFVRQPCYEAKQAFPYRRYLPPRMDSIWLNQRPAFTETDRIYQGGEDELFPKLKDSTHVRNGQFALRLNAQNRFGFSHRFEDAAACQRFSIELWRHNPNHSHSGIVIAHPDSKQFYTFVKGTLKGDGTGWGLVKIELTLPETFKGNVLNIYTWNPGQKTLWLDDFSIIRQK